MTSSKTKILMVCLGNICRSPLAQGILESKLNSEYFIVDSAGTAAYHVGKNPDPRSVKIAEEHNIDIQNQKARQFCKEDFDNFDFIYVMDHENFTNVTKLTTDPLQQRKVKLILNELNPNMNEEVPDPYFNKDGSFGYVYNLIDKACDKIKEKLEN